MNENSINQNVKNKSTRKIETKYDVQIVQEKLKEKREQIIDEAPKLSLAIKKAPYFLNVLFEQDGTPKGDFRISDRYKKKVCVSFKHPHRKSTTGEIYWGNLATSDFGGYNCYSNEYLIQVTPTFLTDEELETLQTHHKLTKKIGNIDIEFIPPTLQRNDYSACVERYRRDIETPRRKIQEISEIMIELESLKSKLPTGTREVIIKQTNEFDNSPGFPHK